MNIRYFFVADVQRRGHVNILYCPTDEMIGDFFTKPLGGAKLRRFHNIVMNISHDEYGPVEIDELTAIHNAKKEKKIEMSECHTENDCEIMSKTEHQKMSKDNDTSSQECVVCVTKVSWKRPLIEKEPY